MTLDPRSLGQLSACVALRRISHLSQSCLGVVALTLDCSLLANLTLTPYTIIMSINEQQEQHILQSLSAADRAAWAVMEADARAVRDRYAVAYATAVNGGLQTELTNAIERATHAEDLLNQARADLDIAERISDRLEERLAARPPTAAADPTASKVKVHVESFTGDRKKTREFLRLVRNAIALYGITDNVMAMRFILAHISGEASMWAENQERLIETGALTTLSQLVKNIELQYKDGVNSYVAQTMLEQLKMKSKEAQDYIARFETLVADAGLPREEFSYAFRRGLPDSVHRRLYLQLGDDATLDEWMQAVKRDDALSRSFDAQAAVRGPSHTPATSRPSHSTTSAPRPPAPAVASLPPRPVATTTTTTTATSGPMDLDASRRQSGPRACYNCGKMGHLARACPDPPRPRQYARATNSVDIA